ncbi:MAG: hypothetical protein M3069_06085 [Chloroflexota bacterium]|nr:hypothetical protein [Chloroflexota bacterium]
MIGSVARAGHGSRAARQRSFLWGGLAAPLLAGLVLATVFPSAWAADNPPAPAGIAVDGDGNVYVSDYALDRVVKFGPDGSVLGQWGGSGSGPGQLNAPFGVAVDDHNTLFVVDQLNNRVQHFAADGSVLGVWGGAGAGASDLRTPFGVAVAGGRVYVADFGNDRVQVFAPDGTLLNSLGGRGSGEGQFQRPAGVCVDRDGTLYVTDHFNDRVDRFTVDGRFQAQIGTLEVASTLTPTSIPTGVATLVAGATPMATLNPTQVATLSASTPATPQATPPVAAGPASSSTFIDPQLRRPEGITTDRDGNLWVADYGRDRVVKLAAADGRLLLSWGSHGSGAGEFLGPKGVAIDPTSGRLYVADTGNARVQRMSPDGTAEAIWPLP